MGVHGDPSKLLMCFELIAMKTRQCSGKYRLTYELALASFKLYVPSRVANLSHKLPETTRNVVSRLPLAIYEFLGSD